MRAAPTLCALARAKKAVMRQNKAIGRSVPGSRESAYKRGYNSKSWDSKKKRVFARDHGMCRKCSRICVHGANDNRIRPHTDHIVPKPLGTDDIDNLQLLCGECHGRKTRKEMIENAR